MADPDFRVEDGLARAEYAMRASSMAFAAQLAAIDSVLRDGRAFPEIFVGPTLGADATEFAERAAIADLAVRLGVAEQTIRAQAHEAETLRRRAPRAWTLFREGDITAPNARLIADLADTLTESCWRAFEDAVLDLAQTLAPARFRARARALRERIEPEPFPERHRRRADERRVWVDNDLDGMCWLTAYLPAEAAHRAMTHLDKLAAAMDAPDETRTLAQRRADAASDLLAGVLGSTGASASVSVTVPVLTLLGGGEPGILDGYGPIDADTARRLAGHAPSFTRLLTHPVTGTVLDVDRTTYRVPADLKRWLAIRDGGCTFPGCGRRASGCDLDHTLPWEHGGTTAAANLAHLCRHHHRLKHNSGWSIQQTDHGITWTSPTGLVRNADPPPFSAAPPVAVS